MAPGDHLNGNAVTGGPHGDRGRDRAELASGGILVAGFGSSSGGTRRRCRSATFPREAPGSRSGCAAGRRREQSWIISCVAEALIPRKGEGSRPPPGRTLMNSDDVRSGWRWTPWPIWIGQGVSGRVGYFRRGV